MTLLDAASALGIPVAGLEVIIDSKIAVSAEGSKLAWERRMRISRMVRQVRVFGPVTEEQRAMLLRAAEFCPVDNTLTQTVEIETAVVPAEGPMGSSG